MSTEETVCLLPKFHQPRPFYFCGVLYAMAILVMDFHGTMWAEVAMCGLSPGERGLRLGGLVCSIALGDLCRKPKLSFSSGSTTFRYGPAVSPRVFGHCTALLMIPTYPVRRDYGIQHLVMRGGRMLVDDLLSRSMESEFCT